MCRHFIMLGYQQTLLHNLIMLRPNPKLACRHGEVRLCKTKTNVSSYYAKADLLINVLIIYQWCIAHGPRLGPLGRLAWQGSFEL